VAEGARLESVFRGNSNVGSNPTLSASLTAPRLKNARMLFPTGTVFSQSTNDCSLGALPRSCYNVATLLHQDC
jgi:hypothetical protein